jgi:hypothetical protein
MTAGLSDLIRAYVSNAHLICAPVHPCGARNAAHGTGRCPHGDLAIDGKTRRDLLLARHTDLTGKRPDQPGILI